MGITSNVLVKSIGHDGVQNIGHVRITGDFSYSLNYGVCSHSIFVGCTGSGMRGLFANLIFLLKKIKTFFI